MCYIGAITFPTIGASMKLTTVATLLFSALSTQLVAAELDASKVKFIGPLADTATIKPNNTPYQTTIVNNLLPKLQSDSKTLTVLGSKVAWQPLGEVNDLTIAGLQAIKFQFSAERFVQGKLKLNGIEKAHVFLNGENLSGSKEYDINAVTGDHQVVIVVEQADDWKKVSLEFLPKAEHDVITLTTKETRALSAKQLFDAPTISSVSISPNGEYYVVTERHYQSNHGNKAINKTTLTDVKGKVIYRFDGLSANQIKWRADSKQVVFVRNKAVTVLNLKDLEERVVAEQLDGAYGFEYFDNSMLVFAWSKSDKSKHTLVKHFRGLEDRWSYARNNNQIFMLDINSGFINPITEGKLSHSLADFDNETGKILVTRNPSDYAKPPHMLTELVEVNLTDNQQTVLGQYRTFSSAKYADDSIYVVAGPDFANGLGRAIPENMLANNYDGQLYKLDRQGQNAQALSKSFDPAIGSMQVLHNDDVVIKVTEHDTQQLYLYDESKARFTKLKTGFDVVGRFSISDERNPDLLVTGTQASHPQQLKRLDISKNRANTLWDSKALAYDNSEIATLSEFNFTNKEGVEIKGRVYTPHNLDESKQYPALVYYYGGTSPVSRGFTGRYPFNLWAAQGYVVYVLQPTGATGFGQEFSAKHVNAWGEYTANDIIEGTKKFLAAHPYVNKDKVGNLGASYGGFMTMLLATKTDLFSASISHAGISNITSYWGQGWWGYLYSGEASKNSFPWNNPKLYSDHSPVFHADKVNSPLLLIHGDADTNVPPGESHNMYTALKLLGKDVELIEYKGTDHQVFARDRRFHWWDTMLAYFDMHLKDQPQWWQYIYK